MVEGVVPQQPELITISGLPVNDVQDGCPERRTILPREAGNDNVVGCPQERLIPIAGIHGHYLNDDFGIGRDTGQSTGSRLELRQVVNVTSTPESELLQPRTALQPPEQDAQEQVLTGKMEHRSHEIDVHPSEGHLESLRDNSRGARMPLTGSEYKGSERSLLELEAAFAASDRSEIH